MQEKLHIRQAIIVEGKYDKIRLDSVVDTLVLATDGFRIFKDKPLTELIKNLAKTCGIVVLTDSDAAGFKIRAHIGNIVKDGEVIHAYIPDVAGKERRKAVPGAEGKLGVEGMNVQVLRQCLTQAGVSIDAPSSNAPITKQDLYLAGFSGGGDSKAKRAALCRHLNLPIHLSANSMPGVLSRIITREELFSLGEALRKDAANP